MNDQSNTPRIYAYKGEHVTCAKGHQICEISRDIYYGEGRSGEHFTNWQQPEPPKDRSVAEIRCTECRAVWVRGNLRAGYQLHFGAPPGGEWR